MAEDKEYKNLPSIDELPWLLGTHEHEKINPKDEDQTFFSINTNNSHIKKIQELQGKSIVASVMGWLILRDRENSTMYSLWNPITRKSISLPELLELPEETEPDTYVFTSPPDYEAPTECVLLLFCKGLVFMCRPTRDGCNWVKQRLEHDGRGVNVVKAAVLDKDIYVYAELDDDDNWVKRSLEQEVTYSREPPTELEPEPESVLFARLTISDGGDGRLDSVGFESLNLKCPSSKIVYNESFDKGPHYLVEACGVLYCVTIIPRQLHKVRGFDILKVFVWRLDLSKMEWIQVDTLGGDCALLLGDNCCAWCCADGGRIEGNCVYMVKPASDTIHQYRLQDSSYTLSLSYFNKQSFWLMPSNPETRLPSFEKLILEKKEDTCVETSKELKATTTVIPKSFLLQLPTQLILSISDSLHWFDCLNLRATCKHLRSVISKPQWKANSELPLFMFLQNNRGLCELWDPCHFNDGSITKTLPYSISVISTIEFSKDEWLLMYSHKGCYLRYINLVTGESGDYPSDDLTNDYSSFLFSTCPTSDHCVTVGIEGLFHAAICFFRPIDDDWHRQYFVIGDWETPSFESHYNTSPKYVVGELYDSFYCLDNKGNLGVCKMREAEVSWFVYKGPLEEEDSKNLSECYIAEHDGELICVFIQDSGYKVQVYTFDVNEILWTELESLENYMLFVSSASSFSIVAKDRSMRNRIYLPKRIGNEMVFYSLDTGKYHTSRSKESYESFHGMISQSFSCWV